MKVNRLLRKFAKNAKSLNVKAVLWLFAKIRNINRSKVNIQEVNE